MEQYVAKTINCSCGKEHKSKVEKIVIKPNVIDNELIDFLKENGYNKLTVVCDRASYRVAGNCVCNALERNKISYKLHMFRDDALIPDEGSVGNLAMGLDLECDIILAVGSGTINDLCRYVSAVAQKPFCTLGTAPSMDGYISGGSALIYNNLKLTFETKAPKAVFFDPEILSKAPLDMVASGVGDLLGKISCLTDWRLSHIINNEWHCDFISDIVDNAVNKAISSCDGIVNGDSKAITTLIEGLLLSGVAMDFSGNSRPASGSEHHMSHFVEMRHILEKHKAVFHGTKVGINTIISLKAYKYVAKLNPDFDELKKIKRISLPEWKKQICDAFLDASEGILNLEETSGKNDVEKILCRLKSIENNWDTIKSLSNNVTKPEFVSDLLKKFNAPTTPQDIGVGKEMAKQMIMYSKEIRNRYTVLQLLYDLNELENFADSVINEYYPLAERNNK